MPNTLLHLGVQAVASRALVRDLDLRWIFLGCVIPDIPWITRRVLGWLGAPGDPLDTLMYAGAQASLAGCLLLAAACACIARRPLLVFAVLAGNVMLHLVLDAVEIKPGNGVHLLAPLSWQLTSFAIIWPDAPGVIVATVAALGIVGWLLWQRRGEPVALVLSPARALAAAVFVASYFTAPLLFLDDFESSDPYYVQTLRDVDERVGREIAFDRRPFLHDGMNNVVITPAGEALRVLNPTQTASGRISLHGTFVTRDAISISEMRVMPLWSRDGFSYLGLILVAAVWAWPHKHGAVRLRRRGAA